MFSCFFSHLTSLTRGFRVRSQVGNLTEVLIPLVNYHMRVAAEERDEYESVPNGRVQRTQAEHGRHLEQYDRKNDGAP